MKVTKLEIPFDARPKKNTICLFDVDGTLCPEKQHISSELQALLFRLRQKCTIGYVSGSSLSRQQLQLSTPFVPVTSLFDFCFAENGLLAFRMGESLAETSFIEWIGETKYKAFVNWVLKYIANLDIPIKRGTFVDFRHGLVNISPIGQGATAKEMQEFNLYDQAQGIRKKMIEALETEFPNLGLKYAIGGQVCFDAFPAGWDKTYCLRHIEAEEKRSGLFFSEIHFFGDMTQEGGNDHEIYEDDRTIGHVVLGPENTEKQIKALFDL